MELLEACADGDLSAVSALLQGGAAADAVSSDPQTTPLLEAVKNATGTAEHTAIVKLLLKASADPDRVPVSGPTGEPPGDSALQHASAEGFLDIVTLLIHARADVNACASLPDDDDTFYDQPPLSFACENGHVLVVEALLANNADVNKRSTENRSPLELAAGSENATDESLLEVVRKLVAAGASLESIDEEDTPLLRAAIAGHALVTRELLDAGSDPDWARESNGETALHVACFEGHAAVVEELARRSTSIDVRKTTTSETALYIACSKGHLDAVKALLKEGVQTDEELNTVPRTGYYPLYIAASNGHAEVVQELQESGCSISTLTTNKDTPLIIAAYNGYAKVIEVLAAAGADVHYTKEGSGETALYYACLQGRLAAVKALIAAKARHSDALFDNQETPLHCAAMGGHAQVVAELLKAGAEHDVTKSDGATPLYSACHGGKLEAHDGQLQAVKELLRAGGDPNASRPMDQGGDSCLIIAAFHQRSRMVEELLKAGADVEYANTDGMCALGWAVKKNVTAMTRALIDHGADPEFYNTGQTSTPLIKAAMTSVTEGEPKAQQDAQDIVSILLDAGASLSQSMSVARKHVPKAVKALQVVKMRRRRDAKTKGESKGTSRTAKQLEEAEVRAQQAMQELLAEEDATVKSKKGKRKQGQAQQSGSQSKKQEKKSKSKAKKKEAEKTAPATVEAPPVETDKVPQKWQQLLEESDAVVEAELSLLGTPVSAASEVGVDSAAAAETEASQEKPGHPDNYVFFCTKATQEECFRRELLGDQDAMLSTVRRIGASTRLFLFNTDTSVLYGAFHCTGSNATGRNLVPEAWAPKSRGKGQRKQSPLPAQVRFSQKQPSLTRNGVRLPLRHRPTSAGPVDNAIMQPALIGGAVAAGLTYPAVRTKMAASQASNAELPALVLPAAEVFRRRALESVVQAMVVLFDGMCPERWQRMKPFTKRKFCQDLQHKWIFRGVAWRNTAQHTDPQDTLTDPLLPSTAAVRSEALRSYMVQQLKAEPYHMPEDHAGAGLLALVELFARAARRVDEFANSCMQLLQRSRGKVAQPRRGRSRNAVWTDAALGVALSEDQKTARNASSAARATVRLQWSDTQYPELGHETVEMWREHFDRLVKRHKAKGLEPELAKARIFSMALRYETLADHKVGTPLALPPTAFDAARSQFGVRHECFTTPWSNGTAAFCSFFPDTDGFFGSRGNFFDFGPPEGSFLVQPPPDLHSMQDACRHAVALLGAAEAPMSFCLVVPAELLVPITDLVEPEHAAFVRQCTVLPRGRHCFIAGVQHRQMGKSEEAGRAVVDKGDSHLYWLQNDAGADKYRVTKQAAAVLIDSCRPQPNGVGSAPEEDAARPAAAAASGPPPPPGAGSAGPAPAPPAAGPEPAGAAGAALPDRGAARREESREAPAAGDEARVPQDTLDDMMERLGGRPLTVTDGADRTEPTPDGEFVPDRQLLAWLDALGLAKYTALFVQAEVDMAAMCLLTNKDLLDIGILPLGVRKKLLHTIAQLPEGAQSCFASFCVMEEG